MYMVWDVSEIYQILMSIFNGTDCLHVYTIEEFYVLMKSKKIIANQKIKLIWNIVTMQSKAMHASISYKGIVAVHALYPCIMQIWWFDQPQCSVLNHIVLAII